MAIDALRQRLLEAKQPRFDHPGLALHRYLTQRDDAQVGKIALLNSAADSTASAAYCTAFNRWQAAHAGRSFRGTLAAPLAVGLGTESPLEVGLTLHHTYGMPIIPGSALKGLCRRAAMLLQRQGVLTQPQFDTLFGGTESASHFVFHDAWYDPGSPQGRPLKRDVITVHHPDYYSKRGQGVWPTDFDDPKPVAFLVVRPRAKFLFALYGPNENWTGFAVRLLKWGLENLGAGGKTNAGYGYFQFDAAPRGAGTRAGEPRAAAAPVIPAAARTLKWEGALVKLDPPSGDVHALYSAEGSSLKAVAAKADRDRVLAGLTDEQRRCLLEKGQPRRLEGATVEVEALGNAWKLLRVEKPVEG